ncbi:U-box domain-containing protein 62 [Nymphaea thermarum]|nr:U-box domain-containing protein 62 [Nymphaea thermarum]
MVSEGTENSMDPPIVFQNGGAPALSSGQKRPAVVGAPASFADQKLFSEERERYFFGRGDLRRGMFLEGGEGRNAEVSVDQEAGRNRRLDGRQWRLRGGSDSDDDDDDQEEEEEEEEDEEEEEEDDDDEGGGNGRGLVNVKGGHEPVVAGVMSGSDDGKENNNHRNKTNGSNVGNGGRGSNNANSGVSVQSVSEKVCEVNVQRENGGCKGNPEKHGPSFGIGGGGFTKDPSVHPSSNARESLIECQSTRLDDCNSARCEKAITVAEPDSYYPHALQRSASSVTKETGGENGCGFSGRKDAFLSGEPGNSLRAILSDPITGTLMDDAMILACGHSFGGGGMQQVLKMQACYSCGQSISADSMAPNLCKNMEELMLLITLRTVVQAFRHEEELQLSKSSKRRRERFEQEKGNFGALLSADSSRVNRSAMFPFVVGDQVVIKGNKRTPERFFGREAVVTSQCLNGWYVVKTLDNAESVKLQYRSLSKFGVRPLSNGMSTKAVVPSWL